VKNMNMTCSTCTRQLVMLAYQRSFLFRLLREPLKFTMRAWVRLAKIDLNGYEFATPVCRKCNRFYKNALKDHSTVFCTLNDLINPIFDKILEGIVGEEAILDAKHMAKNRDQSNPPVKIDRWTSI
jgi:hypothetical protein